MCAGYFIYFFETIPHWHPSSLKVLSKASFTPGLLTDEQLASRTAQMDSPHAPYTETDLRLHSNLKGITGGTTWQLKATAWKYSHIQTLLKLPRKPWLKISVDFCCSWSAFLQLMHIQLARDAFEVMCFFKACIAILEANKKASVFKPLFFCYIL